MRVHPFAVAAVLSVFIAHPFAQRAPATQLRIDEWQAPSRASAVEDVAPASDGSVWYTAQQAGRIGRLDPSTGKFREFTLPAARSYPHCLALDRYGNVWFTVNSGAGVGTGYIAMLDPNSGEVRQFDLPAPNTGDPDALVFDRRGVLWFTIGTADAIGMLDPQTAKITLTPAPAAIALKECMAVNSKGAPFFPLSGNRIGTIDPATGKVREFALPDGGSRTQCLAIAKDDTVYYTDNMRGYLGHLDPVTGQIEEFAAPGGPKSMPFAIVTTSDGSVWYVETGDEGHSALVRFTPASRKMEAFPVPGAGRVRHMSVGQHDELWLAKGESGKIARVTWR